MMHIGASMFISEKELKKRPEESHILELRELLNDFGINAIIPQFDTLLNLYKWQRQILMSDASTEKPKRRPRKMSMKDFRPYYERYINKQASSLQLINELNISMNAFQSLVQEAAKKAHSTRKRTRKEKAQ